MVRFFYLSVPLFLLCLVSSCNLNSNEIHIIEEINVYDSPEENEKIGNNLISYDFSNMIIKDLQIKDPEVLKNIVWQYFVADGSKKVTFRLILNNNAKNYKDQLIPFFTNFVKTKLEEYKERKAYLPEVYAKSDALMDLIVQEDIDSLWTQTSPDFKEMMSRESLNKLMEQRKDKFKPEGNRVINNHQMYSELSGIQSEFHVVDYIYSNKMVERIIIQKTDDRMELAGHAFFIPNN